MDTQWLQLQSIPPEGGIKHYDSQELWRSIFAEYLIPCTIVEPLTATVEIFPQEDGVLLKGALQGVLAFPCDRCTEESLFPVDQKFSSFEEYPAEADPRAGEEDIYPAEIDAAVIRPSAKGYGLEINPLAYAWQELSLSLPVKPLCQSQCKGLCPICGCNRNTESCSCETEQGDSRLAALRGLKISH